MAKTCPSCGYSPIGSFTDNCPLCAEPVGSACGRRRSCGPDETGALSPTARRAIGGGFLVMFVLAGCYGLGIWGGNRTDRDVERQMAEVRAQIEADRKIRTLGVSATQLLQEFQTDPTAADQKYRRKYLEIDGVIERNGTDREDDTPFLVLHAGDDGARLRIECFFDMADEDEESQLKRLKKGDRVTVRGEYGGQVSNVHVRACTLAK
ncbi:tRNA_anti-like protein [Gemmata obscuriglobus]|uniref:tRNA_anti-like n=1 Tax=Gemmata obscuriglobus TaxID=114 RepID=A0A2Z3H0S6_9BACT|nr:hypothetical protein [Gemmata obscuriglobus]AWM38451.1 hypothetical protein C1280_16615 [Gemmata obscuriglobus]QEG28618.1 tRNA_anti-like protein [Gemmata obscuriglobus]VTS06792.1 Uncharacterized protein OS=uncultured bacterium GN=ACD_26C00051G0001 PE=4 SV=1: tRNA_anti-like [Gemmata obscuriglobus UQM 2246]